jgi:hypothetical protein
MGYCLRKEGRSRKVKMTAAFRRIVDGLQAGSQVERREIGVRSARFPYKRAPLIHRQMTRARFDNALFVDITFRAAAKVVIFLSRTKARGLPGIAMVAVWGLR